MKSEDLALQGCYKLYVIGIGYKPLDKRAGEVVLNSGIILASNRLSEIFKEYEEFEAVKDKIRVINNVDETMNFIRMQMTEKGIIELKTQNLKSKTITLLASGDPMFFGIGRRAINEFGKDLVEIIPDMSSIQMAFSRIKEPWDDAFLMSLHGGPDPEKRRRLPYGINDIPFLLEQHNKITILTDRENNPSAVADVIARSKATKQSEVFEIASPSSRNDSIKMYVCQRLGYPDERIIEGMPEEVAAMSFSEPNIVILQKSEQIPSIPPLLKGGWRGFLEEVRFGLTEKEILHSRGLITKDEVRAVTIHKLRPSHGGVFWDIGAGSGAVSVEVARLCPELKVFAIEKDGEQVKNIKGNKIRFNAANIEIIKGEAPDALKDLPSPARVFIGGSGGRLKAIVDFISGKMVSGIIVANATTIETLNEAIQYLENNGFMVEVSEVSVSRTKVIANKRHMSALNPVFIITGEKQ